MILQTCWLHTNHWLSNKRNTPSTWEITLEPNFLNHTSTQLHEIQRTRQQLYGLPCTGQPKSALEKGISIIDGNASNIFKQNITFCAEHFFNTLKWQKNPMYSHHYFQAGRKRYGNKQLAFHSCSLNSVSPNHNAALSCISA